MSLITAKVETITPIMAKQLLEVNDHNRKVSPANVLKIEEALISGEWQVSGQTIIISESGRLLDGQHRIHAVLNTGISMEHLVCRGIKDEAFKVIDTGKNRSGGDVLSIVGVVKGTKISNSIKLMDAYENKHMTRATKLSNTEIVSRYKSDAGYWDMMLDEGIQLSRIAFIRIFGDYTLGVLNEAFSKVDRGVEYLQTIIEADLNEGSTLIQQVKGKLVKLNKEASNRVTTEQKYYVLFAGYNHYIADTQFPKSFPTFDSSESKKVSKAIPYL